MSCFGVGDWEISENDGRTGRLSRFLQVSIVRMYVCMYDSVRNTTMDVDSRSVAYSDSELVLMEPKGVFFFMDFYC